MKHRISFLVASTLVFVKSNAIAMDPAGAEEFSQAPKILFVAPPEYVEAMNSMHAFAALCPRIAQENPIIKSKEEFEAAKAYLGLTKKYNHLLFTGAMFGPSEHGMKDILMQTSQDVLKGLQSYIKTLQGETCIAFHSTTDGQFLEYEMYDVLFKTAQNHLKLLMKIAVMSNIGNTPSAINPHMQAIKTIKERLSPNAEYRKKLQKEIKDAQELVPAVYFLLNPQMQVRPLPSSKQTNRRIAGQKTVNYYQKLSQDLDGAFQDVLSFDSYFQTTSMSLLTNYLALAIKKIPLEEYVQGIQKLTDDCLSLERKGMEFKVLCGPPTSSRIEGSSLPANNLTELYNFFCKRYETPNKSPLGLLEASIFMFIQANKVEEALNRTEALKAFLLKKGPLSEKFQALRASVMALNGNPEEWRKILESKKNHAQAAKTAAEQQKVDQIKQQQTRIKKEQEEAEKLKKSAQNNIKEKKNQEPPTNPKEWFDYTQIFSEEKSEPTSKYALPREKIKTRKAPQGSFDDKPQKTIPSLPLEIKETPQPKNYPLSQNAYKIYQKIRRGEWKFPRNALYNLFDKLGCKVDIEQGKGDHGMIPLPLMMTIHGTEGLVAVLPEFIKQNNSPNQPPRPLTVPNWDEKWDGRVPPYMRNSIVRALDYLGATDETVHK